jgi:integrase
MGMIYKRGDTWWIKYYRNGRCYRESSGSEKKMVAKNFLDQREGEIAQGKIPGIHFDKVRFDELAEDFLADYRINKKKSLRRATNSISHLNTFFAGVSVSAINSSRIRNYIEMRQNSGASNATINRELSALKRMLNLGAKCTPPKVDRVPHIPMLKESNVRKGFFEHHEFLALRDALPGYLKGVVTFGYKTGWRISEVLNLQWSQVDRVNHTVYLNPGESKNDEPRIVYLDDELTGLFQEQWDHRKQSRAIHPFVFLNKNGDNRIEGFRKAWKSACSQAGIGDRIFHDFRRTAVRNMVRAGVPEAVAMKISGHRTRSVFERYNIVNERDLKMAAAMQQTYLSGQAGTKTGTITDFAQRKRDSAL